MSYRTDNVASYDRTLLSSVPDPTRAEKQEGYNVDLLDDSRERRAPSPTNDDQHGSSTMGYSPGAVSYARKDEPASNGHELVVARVPWYRTRRGIIFLIVGILVIIGAVVGGVVGGTHKSSKPQSDTSGQQSTGNATEQGQQSNGVGAAPSSSGVASNPAGQGTVTASTTASTEPPAGLPVGPNPTSSASAVAPVTT